MTASLARLRALPPLDESPGAKIKRLQLEAKAIAAERTEEVREKMTDLAAILSEIAGSGEAYPVGVRELARRFGPDIEREALGLRVLMERVR